MWDSKEAVIRKRSSKVVSFERATKLQSFWTQNNLLFSKKVKDTTRVLILLVQEQGGPRLPQGDTPEVILHHVPRPISHVKTRCCWGLYSDRVVNSHLAIRHNNKWGACKSECSPAPFCSLLCGKLDNPCHPSCAIRPAKNRSPICVPENALTDPPARETSNWPSVGSGYAGAAHYVPKFHNRSVSAQKRERSGLGC